MSTPKTKQGSSEAILFLDAAWMRVIGELQWAGQLSSTPELRKAIQQLTQVRNETGLPAFSQILFS